VSRAIGHAATSVIAAMFVGTYSGLLPRSLWYTVPATAVAAAATANVVVGRRRAPGGAAGRAKPVG
jgi:type IV secretory pathway TrbL component